MSDATIIAKPYAKAAYLFAKDEARVNEWETFLDALTAIIETKQMQALLATPGLDTDQLTLVILKLLGDQLEPSNQNFLKVMSKNKRLTFVPEVTRQFLALKAVDENKTHVSMTTAVEVDEALRQQLTTELSSKLNTDSELDFSVDENIIGGAVLRIGDKVIDISLQNALRQLQKELRTC